MLLIAHRGESYDAPENTLAAIGLAWDRGATAVEIDARLCADGVLMVSHDPDTRRIGGTRRPIYRQTEAELRRLDAGAWKHARWAGARMPRLRDVLATVPTRGRLFIEMKEGAETVPPLQADLAQSRLRPAQATVMSFHEATVAAAVRALPENEVCLLLRARDYRTLQAWSHAIVRARQLGARSLDVEAHSRLNRTLITAAHTAGLNVYTWTVNRTPIARRLAAAGIDGITTDRRAWLAAQLGQ